MASARRRGGILKRPPRPHPPPQPPQPFLHPLPLHITERIPQEIYDLIIAFLAAPKCALVCSAWLHTARCADPAFTAFTVPPNRLDRFVALIDSPHATLTHYVQRVCVAGPRFGAVDGVEGLIAHVVQRVPALRALECLRFESLGWPNLDDGVLHISPHLDALTALELKGIEFPSLALLVDVLYSVPALERLAMHLVWWRLDDIPEPRAVPPLPRLQTLALGACFQADFVEWFLAHGRIPAVGTVRLRHMTEGDGPSVARFLRALGPVLRVLDLYESPCMDDVDLSYNTSLHTLAVHSVPLKHPAELEYIPTLLDQIASSDMRQLALGLSHRSIGALDNLDFARLNRILGRPHFREMRRVQFWLARADGGDAEKLRLKHAWAWIRARLPGCDVRGILSVDGAEEDDVFWT